jgi:hypothetical protein
MTFDDIPRPESRDAPVVTRVNRKPQPTPPEREAREAKERELADGEPHFPRIFPGI